MLTIDCENPTIDISLPDCVALITLATLARAGCPSYTLQAELVPPGEPGTVRFNGVPAGITKGVWQLSFETDCGCFSAPVHVDICRAPAFQSEHQPTRDAPPYIVCCAPAVQPNLALPNAALSLHFSASSDNAQIGIDSTAVPPYGSIDAPVFTLQRITATGLILTGVLQPVPNALHGQPWMLYDSEGRTLANGTLGVVAGSATLGATLDDALLCGQHYLRLGAIVP